MDINGKIIKSTSLENWLVNYTEKILSQKVILGTNGKIDDWKEITEEEKETLEKEWEESIEVIE